MLISWQSKEQASVALLSMEAENMPACACPQEGIWLKRLLEEFGCRFSGPLTVFEDNMACIFYSRNPGDHQRTKHTILYENRLLQETSFYRKSKLMIIWLISSQNHSLKGIFTILYNTLCIESTNCECFRNTNMYQ